MFGVDFAADTMLCSVCVCVCVVGLSDAIRCHLSARTQTGLWHYDLTLAKVSEHLVP
jgi:hypothetical protein